VGESQELVSGWSSTVNSVNVDRKTIIVSSTCDNYTCLWITVTESNPFRTAGISESSGQLKDFQRVCNERVIEANVTSVNRGL